MVPLAPQGANAGATRTIAGLSLLVVLLLGASILPWQRPATIVAAPSPVRVADVTVGDLRAAVALSGELRPTDQIDVTPRISSRVTRLPATVGRVVRAGEVLAELDRTQLEVATIQAQATVAKEKAALAKLQVNTGAEDFARDESALKAAEASLAQILKGPRSEDVESALQKLNQARESRIRTASTLANGREQARLAVDQAVATVQQAQALYGASKLIYDEAVRTEKDPNIASCPSDNKRCNNLTDTKRRSYKAEFEAREIALRSAETALEAREMALNDAKRQEAVGLQIAVSQIADAQAAFDKARSGPQADDIASAEADIEAARAQLIKLQNPTLEPEIAAAQASIQSAEASLRLADANLREATVVAPFTGIVTQRFVSVGSNVSSSTAIVQLVSATLEARLSADDSQVVLLEPGQKAELRLTAYPGVVFDARVDGISPAANPTSRTFTATVLPDVQDSRLKPGMLVQGDVAAINRPSVLMVPEQAVVTRGLDSHVYVVADGKARRKTVAFGVRGGGMVEVISGLTAGEKVVVDGQAALNDNDQVTVTG